MWIQNLETGSGFSSNNNIGENEFGFFNAKNTAFKLDRRHVLERVYRSNNTMLFEDTMKIIRINGRKTSFCQKLKLVFKWVLAKSIIVNLETYVGKIIEWETQLLTWKIELT